VRSRKAFTRSRDRLKRMDTHPYATPLSVALPCHTVEPDARTRERAATGALPTICHVTVAHRELKSRTFYMQLAPLAAIGFPVRYVSPVAVTPQGKSVTFIPTAVPQSRLARVLRTPRLLRTLLAQHAAIYHIQDPELLPAAFVLKLLFRKHVVFDSYEDFASMALQSQRIPGALKPLAERAVLKVQKLAARVLDAVITADPLTLRRFARTGHSRKLVFYNLPNLDVFPPPRYEGAKRFDIVYRGGVSERAGTWTLLEALHELKSRGHTIKTLLIGYFDNPDAKAELVRRIASHDLGAEITVGGRIDHATMPHVLSQAKIGVSPLLNTPKFCRNIPVKIFEYWASGLPVVASDLPPIRPFYKSVNAGLLFQPGDSRGLANAISRLLVQPDVAREMGRRGREAVERRWNHRSEVRKLQRLLTEIAVSN
jgi:glycosyltransferase involved in cell wall biosynthesis